MKRKALLLFTAQQVCFLTGVVVCIALRPLGLAANDGISYYGNFVNTFPWYLLALLGTALFSALAGRLISQPELRPLRWGLLAFALLTVIIAFTPYFVSTFLDWAHTLTGVVEFMIQLALSVWLTAKLLWAGWPVLFLGLETITGAISLAYVLPNQGFLIQGQISFQLAFSALLLYGFKKLLPPATA